MSDRKAWDIIEWASKVLAIDEKGTNSTLSRDLIGAAKTLEQAGVAWISVKDRLPESGKRVIATDGTYAGEAYMDLEGCWYRNFGINPQTWQQVYKHPVTHWMPMPALPGVSP